MKGIILAGGMGTRMGDCTKVINKHLLPVYNKPMIYYPINTLKNIGIKDILIIIGGHRVGDIPLLLGDGSNLDVNITYRVQKEPKGIAHALLLAEKFVGNDTVIVLLGDNYFEENLGDEVNNFNRGAKIFLKETKYPCKFGIAMVRDNKVVNIEEKPENPKTNLAVTGLYIYDNKVFDIIRTLKPSDRGELEITDVNNVYIKNNQMSYYILKNYWGDMGEPDSLFETAYLLYKRNNK